MAKNPYWMIAADGQFLGVAALTYLLVINFHGLEITPPGGTHSAGPKDFQNAG